MTCSILSVAGAMAGAGMMGGLGLQVPSGLTSVVGNFSTTGLTGLAQGALGAAGGVLGGPLAGLGAGICPALTGVVPSSLTSVLSSGGLNSFASQILGQANQILGDAGIGNFSQIFSQAQGFVQGGYQMLQFASQVASIGNSLGINMGGFSSFLTNGLGVLGNLNNFGTIMSNCGRLFDMTNMSLIGNPGSLVQNLVNNGLGDVSGITDKLVSAGIPLNDILNPNYAGAIKSVLSTVQGGDLTKILGAVGANLPNISDLSQVLDFKNVAEPLELGGEGGVDVYPDWSTIGNKFADMGASFASGADIAKLVQSIQTPGFPRLDSFLSSSFMPPEVKTLLSAATGIGSGKYGNPTIQDLIGTVAGVTHIASFIDMKNPLAAITSSVPGQLLGKQMSLLTDVANGAYGGGGNVSLDKANPSLIGQTVTIPSGVLDAVGMTNVGLGDITGTLANMRVYVENTMKTISTATDLAAHVQKINSSYLASAEQLSKEKTNLALAGIDLTRPPATASAITNTQGIIYNTSYPTAPLTNWSADDLFKYWQSLPWVDTGNVSAKSDICRGIMYNTSSSFSNGSVFTASVDSYLVSNGWADSATWQRSLYPEVLQVTFDVTTGICYFQNNTWRSNISGEDRPIGYPSTGVPKIGTISSVGLSTSSGGTTTTSGSGGGGGGGGGRIGISNAKMATLAPADSVSTPGSGITVDTAGIAFSGDKNAIMSLAQTLPDLGVDEMGLGGGKLLRDLATNDIWGDAIKAAMIEGKNKKALVASGIIPAGDKIMNEKMEEIAATISDLTFDNVWNAEPSTKYSQSQSLSLFSEVYNYSITSANTDDFVAQGSGTIVPGKNNKILVTVTTPKKYDAAEKFTVTLTPTKSNSKPITSTFIVAVRKQKIYINKVNFTTITQQIPTSTIDSDVVVISGIDETEGVYLDSGDIGGNILIVNASGTILQDINPGDTGEVVGTVTNGTRLKLRAQTPNFGEERTLTLNQIVQTTGEVRPIGTWTIRNKAT